MSDNKMNLRMWRLVTSMSPELRQQGGQEIIYGYAAVFYDGTEKSEYNWGNGVIERVRHTAFDRVLADPGADVVVTFNHNPDNILGRRSAGTLSLSKDSVGLKYEVLLPQTQLGTELAHLIARGDIRGSSFAFSVVAETFEHEKNNRIIRWLDDVNLIELGPVVLPAYSGTSVALALRSYAMSRLKELRSVVPYEETPPYDDSNWDEQAALARVQEWASSEGSMNWEMYRRAFAWYDVENSEQPEAYRLLHHDIVDGQLVTHKGGIIAAMQAILSTNANVNIPAADLPEVYSHLAQHYAQFGMEPPEADSIPIVVPRLAHALYALSLADE
ncbi:MAG: HK97 family phage prohead protease [Gemmatales bacterium]|nr:HK97 family phage prohead protease [Gemmatales bacterium]MDW8175133.1 HK97 family phage prohead protease [Gemmatales bacterium]